MSLAAVLLFAYPLVRSMSVTAKQENAAWGACDVSNLTPGALTRCKWALVYRRTPRDKDAIGKFAHLLEDPESQRSQQPDSARNQWRSENPDYFVFLPYAPVRSCGVELRQAGGTSWWWEPPEQEAIDVLPHFFELCEGRMWDTSGRLYKRNGYPSEKNLIVPEVRWKSKTKLLVYAG